VNAPNSLIDHRFLAVTGKGGVGKTLVAAGIASAAAATGKRTLLCDIDASGDAARLFGEPLGITASGASPVGYEPVSVLPNLSLMQMELRPAIVDYLRTYARLGFATTIGPLARTFEFVAKAAPGVSEVLSIGKLLDEVRNENFDLVVMDGPASGHVVGLLRAPAAVGMLTGSGALGGQSKWMTKMLADPAQTGAVVVATPEELPVSEASDLIGELMSNVRVNVAGVVMNRLRGVSLPRSAAALLEQIQVELDLPERLLLDELRSATRLRGRESDLSGELVEAAPPGAAWHAISELGAEDGPMVEQMRLSLEAEW
jgi:anion-transporting  ArsA/GET3 family ATPase